MPSGKLYLIPSVIAEGTQGKVIPPHAIDALSRLRYFLVEDIRTARRFISSLKIVDDIASLEFGQLNKDTSEEELLELMKPLLVGADAGLLSEAGCPGVADPGSIAVAFAHRNNIEVVPLVGPSSIVLALMASGMNGQQFAFHGYLPIDEKKSTQLIQKLERESRAEKQTQIFIETPFRNARLLEYLVKSLDAETLLCVAVDLTGADQKITTKKVKEWKREKVELPKVPAIFLLLALPVEF